MAYPSLYEGAKRAQTAKHLEDKAEVHQLLDIDSVQGAFRLAKKAAGITKRGVSVHTLRHCYATHLLEAGVNPRIVQRYLGHSRLETTMNYFHLTQKGTEDACRIINAALRNPVLLFMNARTAVMVTSLIALAATGIAPVVKIIKQDYGWKNKSLDSCPDIISC